MFYNIVRSFKRQPRWFQTGLCTPLDALSYTSNVLLVSAALGVLGAIFLTAFAGDLSGMAQTISSINDIERKYLNEKINVISVDLTDTQTIITLSNYGKYPVDILDILDGIGHTLTCTSNNNDDTNFVISPGELVEFSCEVESYDADTTHYILTDTMQIISAQP